eukprot:g16452.t1
MRRCKTPCLEIHRALNAQAQGKRPSHGWVPLAHDGASIAPTPGRLSFHVILIAPTPARLSFHVIPTIVREMASISSACASIDKHQSASVLVFIRLAERQHGYHLLCQYHPELEDN